MTMTPSRYRFAFMLLAGLCVCSSPVMARRAPVVAKGTFNNVVFLNTSGRVGYHMFATVHIESYDTPIGDAVACQPAASDTTVQGVLPPGLVLLASDGGGVHGFDGTPRQPGDWAVSVTIAHIECGAGADRADYGPRTIPVHFHIDP